MEEVLYGSDQQMFDQGRDIPGETAPDEDMMRGIPANLMARFDNNAGSFGISQLQFQDGGFPVSTADMVEQRSLHARELTDLVQTSAASPALPRSQNNSLQGAHAVGKETEPLLFTPIKMLDFNELEDTDKHGRLVAASLSKSSTPNARYSGKKVIPGMPSSPEKAVVLSVDEINASPIWHHSYSDQHDQAVDRELEQRLELAGHLGEESPSDRGSRERSPVIDGAEYEDTIQNRFQSMQIKNSRSGQGTGVGKQAQSRSTDTHKFNQRIGSQARAQQIPGQHRHNSQQNFVNGAMDMMDNNNFTRPTQLQGKAQSDIETRLGFQLGASQFPVRSLQSDIVTFPHQTQLNQQNNALFELSRQPLGNLNANHVEMHKNRQLPHNFEQSRLFQFGREHFPPPVPAQNPAAFTTQPNQLALSKLQADDTANAYFYTPAVHTGHGSVPQMMNQVSPSEAPVSEPPDPQDMERVWGHLQSVIKEGEALLGNDEDDQSDGVSDLLAGQGQSTLQKLMLDHSPDSQAGSLWMGARGVGDMLHHGAHAIDEPSHRIWGDNSSSRYQSDPTLVAENRVLKETLEKERYRRKHCENHIQQLNAKLLETQQQLAVVMSQDKKKDTMIEQLDKQFARVVEGWKRKEVEKEEFIKQMKIEKARSDESLQKQLQILSQFERELADTVEELRKERETSSLAIEKYQTQIEEQEREMTNLTEVVESEKERAELMTAEWERVKEGRDQAENKVEHLQDTLHKEQDNWYKREHELLQKLDELTETNLRAIQEEKQRTDEKGRLLEDVECQLKLIMSEVGKLEIELDAAHREKESLKVEMSLNESKYENSLRKLEADLKVDTEKQISEKLAEAHRDMEECEQKLSEKHRKYVQELSNQHKEDLEQQLEQFHEEQKQKDDEHRKKMLEYEEQLNEYRVENNSLKNKKHKLEVQRTEVLSKLQLLMQSQWNEAVSLLGAVSPGRLQGNNKMAPSISASSSRFVGSGGQNSSVLSGLNLSMLSQPPVHSTANNTDMENAASTPNRENVVSLLNGDFLSQQQPNPSQHASGTLPWQPRLHQQQQQHHPQKPSSVLHNGPSSLPAALSELLNLSHVSSLSGFNNYQRDENDTSARQPHFTQGSLPHNEPPHQPSSLPTQQYNPAHTKTHHSDQWSRHSHDGSHVALSGQLGLNRGPSTDQSHKFIHEQGLVGQGESLPQHSYPGHYQGDNTRPSGQDWTHTSQKPYTNSGQVLPSDQTTSFLDTTQSSQQDSRSQRNVSVNEMSSRAVPIRPPQQRTHQSGHVTTNGESRRPTGRHSSQLRSTSYSLRRPSPNEHSPSASSDFIRRVVPDFSDDCSSLTDGNSENGDFAKPRRLDFSPPTKQPRPQGGSGHADHNSSAGTVEDGANNSVLDETMRLNEEYSHISDKLERHESRQSELQHYIQMLLQKSPGLPVDDEQDGQCREGEVREPSRAAADLHRKLQTLRAHAYHGAESTGDLSRASSANQTRIQPRHSVAKQQGQRGHDGSLQEDQLQEISRLLDLYGTQSPGAEDSPQSPRAVEILHLLQSMQASRKQMSNSRGANKTKPAGAGRAGAPVRKTTEKSRKTVSQGSQLENGRDVSKSDSMDKGVPTTTRAAPPNIPKKMERKMSAGSSQNKNNLPKWK